MPFSPVMLPTFRCANCNHYLGKHGPDKMCPGEINIPIKEKQTYFVCPKNCKVYNETRMAEDKGYDSLNCFSCNSPMVKMIL